MSETIPGLVVLGSIRKPFDPGMLAPAFNIRWGGQWKAGDSVSSRRASNKSGVLGQPKKPSLERKPVEKVLSFTPGMEG